MKRNLEGRLIVQFEQKKLNELIQNIYYFFIQMSLKTGAKNAKKY